MKFLCLVTEVPHNGSKRIGLADRAPLAIHHFEGRYYGTDDLCTHGQASLADGFIELGSIVCPLHFGAFDLVTGEPTAAPCSDAVRTHELVVQDGAIYLVD